MHQPNQARTRRNRVVMCAGLLFLLTSFLWPGIRAGAQTGPRIGIANFGRISQNYYRGAQPNAAEFTELQQLGIKTIIDLQEDGNSSEPA